MVSMAGRLKLTSSVRRPFSRTWRGIRYWSAMLIFSPSVYPDRVMISIRSRSGSGIGSSWLAVVMNITCERS